MSKINSVEDLDVFKRAHLLVLKIYELTKLFPSDERFELISQIRRSAYSITSNLIEGGNRLGSKEYRQFVGIARGSAAELKYQLFLAKDLKYMSVEQYNETADEIFRAQQYAYGVGKCSG